MDDVCECENKVELKNSIGTWKRCLISEINDNNFFYKKVVKRKILLKRSICNINENRLWTINLNGWERRNIFLGNVYDLHVQEESVRKETVENRGWLIHSWMYSLRCDYILHAHGCIWWFKVHTRTLRISLRKRITISSAKRPSRDETYGDND